MIVEVSGRPLFAFGGTVPAYRDLATGDTGTDVAQLQRGLTAIGYPAGGRHGRRRSGPGTAAAVAAFYTALGLHPCRTGPDGEAMVPRAEIMFVPRFPARVLKVAGPVGQQPTGSLATLAMGRPGVAGQLDPTDGGAGQGGHAGHGHGPGHRPGPPRPDRLCRTADLGCAQP